MNKILKTFIFGLLAMTVFSVAVFAQKGSADIIPVKFARGKTSATVKGVITDRLETKSYVVRARAGQTLTVVFNSPRRDVDVCLFLPDGRDFCGRRKYSFGLETDGDYVILVDGHRENIPYTLTVSVK